MFFLTRRYVSAVHVMDLHRVCRVFCENAWTDSARFLHGDHPPLIFLQCTLCCKRIRVYTELKIFPLDYRLVDLWQNHKHSMSKKMQFPGFVFPEVVQRHLLGQTGI